MPAAKLFIHGGSQAVRLPKEFRFEGSEVHVRRVGNEVVLSAVPPAGPDALIDALMAFEPGTMLQREQPVEQQRRVPLRPAR
jgi:antitoxin VapB